MDVTQRFTELGNLMAKKYKYPGSSYTYPSYRANISPLRLDDHIYNLIQEKDSILPNWSYHVLEI